MVCSIVKLAPTKNRKNFSPNEFTFEIITCIFAIVFSGSYITKFPSKYKFDGKLDISRKITKNGDGKLKQADIHELLNM